LSIFFIGIRGQEHFLEVLKKDYQLSFADSSSSSKVRKAAHMESELIKSNMTMKHNKCILDVRIKI